MPTNVISNLPPQQIVPVFGPPAPVVPREQAADFLGKVSSKLNANGTQPKDLAKNYPGGEAAFQKELNNLEQVLKADNCCADDLNVIKSISSGSVDKASINKAVEEIQSHFGAPVLAAANAKTKEPVVDSFISADQAKNPQAQESIIEWHAKMLAGGVTQANTPAAAVASTAPAAAAEPAAAPVATERTIKARDLFANRVSDEQAKRIVKERVSIIDASIATTDHKMEETKAGRKVLFTSKDVPVLREQIADLKEYKETVRDPGRKEAIQADISSLEKEIDFNNKSAAEQNSDLAAERLRLVAQKQELEANYKAQFGESISPTAETGTQAAVGNLANVNAHEASAVAPTRLTPVRANGLDSLNGVTFGALDKARESQPNTILPDGSSVVQVPVSVPDGKGGQKQEVRQVLLAPAVAGAPIHGVMLDGQKASAFELIGTKFHPALNPVTSLPLQETLSKDNPAPVILSAVDPKTGQEKVIRLEPKGDDYKVYRYNQVKDELNPWDMVQEVGKDGQIKRTFTRGQYPEEILNPNHAYAFEPDGNLYHSKFWEAGSAEMATGSSPSSIGTNVHQLIAQNEMQKEMIRLAKTPSQRFMEQLALAGGNVKGGTPASSNGQQSNVQNANGQLPANFPETSSAPAGAVPPPGVVNASGGFLKNINQLGLGVNVGPHGGNVGIGVNGQNFGFGLNVGWGNGGGYAPYGGACGIYGMDMDYLLQMFLVIHDEEEKRNIMGIMSRMQAKSAEMKNMNAQGVKDQPGGLQGLNTDTAILQAELTMAVQRRQRLHETVQNAQNANNKAKENAIRNMR